MQYEHAPSSAGSDEAVAPSTADIALAANLLGVSPKRSGRRAILTSTGLVALEVVDRFTELAVELHWAEIADVLAGKPPDRLAEIQGFELEGHQLAYALEQIPRAADVREEVR
jgi:hypothetical protein